MPSSGPSPEIVEGFKEFELAIEAGNAAEEQVMSILSWRLRAAPDEDAFGKLLDAFSDYLGRPARAFLAAVVADFDDEDVDALAKVAPRTTKIRTVAKAVYGTDLDLAFEVWNEHPDDWRYMSPAIYTDVRRRRKLVAVRLEKNSGESCSIIGPPESLVRLARQVLTVLAENLEPEAFRAEEMVKPLSDLLESAGQIQELRATVAAPEAASEGQAELMEDSEAATASSEAHE